MADEDLNTASPDDELRDFAHSFVTDDEPAAEVDPAPEPDKGVEEVKPDPDKPTPVEDEEEDIFELDKPKDDKPADDKEDIPDKPGAPDAWSRLKESREKHKAAAEEKETLLREKEAEVAELKTKAARTVELEEKLKLFEEQEKELALARVESTLEWKNNLEAPLVAIGTEAAALAGENEADFEPIRLMLQEPDRTKQRVKLKELTAGWDEVDRSEIKKMADDARVLLDKQDAMRKNAHATAKEQQEISAKREAEQKDAARKAFTKETGDVVKSLRDKLPFVPLAEGETEDDRYTSLAEKVARVDFDAQTPRAKALAAASALALPQAIKTIAAKDKEITELKEALARKGKDDPLVNPKADEAADEGDKDFFAEFGIQDRSKMFGTE